MKVICPKCNESRPSRIENLGGFFHYKFGKKILFYEFHCYICDNTFRIEKEEKP